jgi:hypothetical protein
VGRGTLVRRVVAVACVVALLGAAVAIGVAWGWADSGYQGHRASASVPVASLASPASGVAVGSATPSATEPVTAAPSATDPTPTVTTPMASPSPDWLSVVAALDRGRDGAFADADAGELDAIYVPGSDALITDRATLGRLVGAGQRVRGLQFVLESVRVVAQSPGEVTLAVVDTLAGYDVVDAAGVATHVPGRGIRSWSVVLRAQPPGELRWRIASIAPA